MLDNGNACSVWLMTIPGQTGDWKLEKTVEQIHKKTLLNMSFKGSTEDLPPVVFGVGSS